LSIRNDLVLPQHITTSINRWLARQPCYSNCLW